MVIGTLLQNTTIDVLKKGIEGTNLRHKAIANNIANADTPKYQRATVEFEQQLKRALKGVGFVGQRTHPAHFIIGGPNAVRDVAPRPEIDHETRFRPDKNNVNIDQEMAHLAENSQRNMEFTELLNRRYSGIQNVIQQSGRV